jgi:hypothetical protein
MFFIFFEPTFFNVLYPFNIFGFLIYIVIFVVTYSNLLSIVNTFLGFVVVGHGKALFNLFLLH